MKIYFDETNHSRKTSVSKNGDNVTYDVDDENWFYYIFFGVKNQLLVEQKMIELEKRFFNVESDSGEIKSSRLLSKASFLQDLNKNKKDFYINLLSHLSEEKQFLQVGAMNKICELLRKWLNYIFDHLPDSLYYSIDYENFIIFISKFIVSNCQYEFLQYVKKTNDVKNHLRHLRFRIESAMKILVKKKLPLANSFLNCLNVIQIIIENLPKSLIFDCDFSWKYEYIKKSLKNLINETEIKPDLVVIDQEENIYNSLKGDFNVIQGNSKTEPMIRICDHLIGLIRFITISVKNAHQGQGKIDMKFEMKNPYNEYLFKVDLDTIKILKLLNNLFDPNIYWETFTNIFSDEIISTLRFIELMAKDQNPNSEKLNSAIVISLAERNKELDILNKNSHLLNK